MQTSSKFKLVRFIRQKRFTQCTSNKKYTEMPTVQYCHTVVRVRVLYDTAVLIVTLSKSETYKETIKEKSTIFNTVQYP